MVKLNKIYTRTGDDGTTSLVGGGRVSKHARRPSAFGEVDELNSVLGLARLHCKNGADMAGMDAQLARIQNDLFDLGADLATAEETAPALRITTDQVTRLEQEINELSVDVLGYRGLPMDPVEGGNPYRENFTASVVPRYLNNRAASIFGGSQEVQRNIVAKAILEL